MSQFNDKPKAIIFELERYTLFAAVEGNARASMSFAVREGYPRVTVFTRSKSDMDGKGMINVPFELDTFLVMLMQLEQIARTEGRCVMKIDAKHWPRDGEGKIKGDLEVTSELFIGKNDDGIVWLSAQAPNRPKIVFELTLSDYNGFTNVKGEKLTKAEGSKFRTLALISALRFHMTQKCLTFRDTSIPRDNKGPYSGRAKTAAATASATATVASDLYLDDDITF